MKDELIPIEGSPPDLFAPPKGCPYTDRCPSAMKVCDHIMPHETQRSPTHAVHCWLQDERAKQTVLSSTQRGVFHEKNRLDSQYVLYHSDAACRMYSQ